MKAIAIVIVLAVLLLAGCGRQSTQKQPQPAVPAAPSAAPELVPTPPVPPIEAQTTNEVGDLDKGINEVQEIDTDISDPAAETIDSDLANLTW